MMGNIRHFLIRVVIPLALLLCIFMSLPLVCGHNHGHGHDHHGHAHHGHGHAHHHGHGHAHHHGHGHEEPASFKWSKEANEHYKEDSEDHKPSHPDPQERKLPSKQKSSIWMEAILSTVLISIAPYLILFFIPISSSKDDESFLKLRYLLAFASGGLLGDAFLHLIPHALLSQTSENGGHTHSHSHSHSHGEEGGHDLTIGMCVLGGIIIFFVVEKFVIIFKGGHSHSHSHEVQNEKSDKKPGKKNKDKKSGNEFPINFKEHFVISLIY